MGGGGSSSGIAFTNSKGTDSGVEGYGTDEALIKYQAEGVYAGLNSHLRHGETLTEEESKTEKGLDNSFKEEKDFRTVYRGLGQTAGQEIEKSGFLGQWEDKGFTSTSTEKSVAWESQYGQSWRAKVVLSPGTKTIDVNKTLGSKSEYEEEHEIIVARGTKYGIAEVNKNTRTVTLVSLTGKVNEKNFVAASM